MNRNKSLACLDGCRRFRGIREGGASCHADFWVFIKNGTDRFDAIKIDQWHQFVPVVEYRTLDIEQAELQFLKRSRILNQFALKAQISQHLLSKEEDGEKVDTKRRNLKISDKDEVTDSDDDEGEGDEGKDGGEKRMGKGKESKKDKRTRVDNSEDVAAYESEDGQDEGREYDYMSDSGTDSDRDNVPMEVKVEQALVGVDDELGLKRLIDSDEEDDDDHDRNELKSSEKSHQSDGLLTKIGMQIDDERDSSGSDSDDPDKKKIESVVFLPRTQLKEELQDEDGGDKKPDVAEIAASRKRILDDQNDDSAKRVKIEISTDSLNEQTVRKYLYRKPHSTKELIRKFTPKCQGMTKTQIVTRLADILKKVEPHQFKQKHGGKHVLFFSLGLGK